MLDSDHLRTSRFGHRRVPLPFSTACPSFHRNREAGPKHAVRKTGCDSWGRVVHGSQRLQSHHCHNLPRVHGSKALAPVQDQERRLTWSQRPGVKFDGGLRRCQSASEARR